tara:strand:+ start:295 stop:468 length:174 start_codon:yes stop_codon:yes gene_type:complete
LIKKGVDGKRMKRDRKGDYVRYCDARKEIAELKKQIEELKDDQLAESEYHDWVSELG